jgi:uncharacterized damage-inducible protein DinB
VRTTTPAPEVVRVVRLLDEAYNRKSWHGTNLRGSIRGLSAEQAGWQAGGAKHSVADIVVHCAYWKYAVRRRLRGDPRGSFPLKGSNWCALREPLTESTWRRYVALLEAEHRALRDAVAELPPGRLSQAPGNRKTTNLALIHGIALHDVYHAGQIQMLKGIQRRMKTGE